MRTIILCLCVIAVFPSFTLCEAAPQLKAGYAVADITPKGNLFLPKQFPALGTYIGQKLEARVLVLDDGNNRVAFVSLDLIGLFKEDIDVLRNNLRDVFPDPANVIVASTHTHSSPDTLGLWSDSRMAGSSGAQYVGYMLKQVEHFVRSAIEEEDLVTSITAAQGNVAGLIRNDRDSALLDAVAFIIFIERAKGRPVALANFAAHPEIMRKTDFISPDFVGVMRDEISRRIGADAMFMNGALGGMIVPNIKRSNSPIRDTRRYGCVAADALLKIFRSRKPLGGNAAITVKRREFSIPLDNKRFEKGIAAGKVPKVQSNGEIFSEVSVAEIGTQLVFAAIPGEASPEIASAIRKLFPQKYVVFLGLAGDELGYILPSERYREKRYEYERSLAVNVNIGTKIISLFEILTKTAH